jgi:hypothetical protein
MRTSVRRGGLGFRPLLSLHSRTAVRRHFGSLGLEKADHVTENDMGMARSMHGEESAYLVLVGTPEDKRNH